MLDNIADGFKQLVSSEMSVFVIHLFKVVNIYDCQEEIMILTVCPPGLFEYLGVKITPVIETCQAVGN